MAAESDARGIFNIGTGQKSSIGDLAKIIIRLLGKNIEPVFREERPGDIRHSLADISRAGTFGYKSQYNLEEGLKEMIENPESQMNFRKRKIIGIL
jgi:UDP-glucose 4-epimerase